MWWGVALFCCAWALESATKPSCWHQASKSTFFRWAKETNPNSTREKERGTEETAFVVLVGEHWWREPFVSVETSPKCCSSHRDNGTTKPHYIFQRFATYSLTLAHVPMSTPYSAHSIIEKKKKGFVGMPTTVFREIKVEEKKDLLQSIWVAERFFVSPLGPKTLT